MAFDRHVLIKLRIQNKITQWKLAELSDVDYHNICGLENGRSKNPSFDTVDKIADAFSELTGKRVLMDDFKTGKI